MSFQTFARPRRKQPAPCPRAELHTEQPNGYLAWHAWAQEMAETHDQHRCPGCNRWQIWTPRETA